MKMNMLRFIGAQTVDLPLLGEAVSGPFVLKGTEGLGPTDITVMFGKTVLDKGLYQGKSAALRQVTALVGLQPNWDTGQTAEELRTILYSLLTPRYGQMVRMEVLYNGVVQAYAEGQIGKMEPALHTKDPAVQIVLECDYPYLLGPDTVAQQPVQRDVGGIRAFDVLNNGTAPAGFQMGLILRANVGTSLILSDEDPRGQKLQIDGLNWVSGDRFVVDTRAGSRGVWRGPGGGALVPVLNNLNGAVSEWIQLYGGDNALQINTAAFDWDPAFNFTHQPAFWGV